MFAEINSFGRIIQLVLGFLGSVVYSSEPY